MYLGKKILELRTKANMRTDRRVQLMSEIINGIRVIKMYTWEPIFEQLTSVARRLIDFLLLLKKHSKKLYFIC